MSRTPPPLAHDVRFASGDLPVFIAGDHVRVLTLLPIGHYRVPHYIRGMPLRELWVNYQGSPSDELRIEVYEALGTDLIGRLSYYERWAVAFANLLFEKQILTPGEVARKMDDVAARFTAAKFEND